MDDYAGPIEKLDESSLKKTPSGWHKYWASELQAAHKRVKKWHKDGHRIEARYQDRRGEQANTSRSEGEPVASRVNLFHANVKTLQDMLYGAAPKVDVDRANKDYNDDDARVASLMWDRLLNVPLEESGSDFNSALHFCIENRLLPGLGIARVRYDYQAFEEEVPPILGYTEDGEKVELAEGYTDEIIEDEFAPIDYVHWDDFRWGWAKTWKEVPWIAFRTYVKKSDAEKRFDKSVVKEMKFTNKTFGNVSEKRLTSDEVADAWDRAEIWEIWDKERRMVFWWSPEPQKILDKKEDTLELDGFWPTPEPMLANTTTSLLLPQPDFKLAMNLYNQIDNLQNRIDTITEACRVVGVYNKSADGVVRIFQEGVENDLIPVEGWSQFKEGGGLEGAIEWVPIKEIAEVLDKLVQQRTDAMQLLYEVTGMSEIMRGANGPDRETAEASSGKRQFASVRVQGLQNEIARFASDLIALRAEVISKHFSPETIIARSNISMTPDASLAGQAVQLMKNWKEMKWRFKIQPESMALIDYAARKADRVEFLGALSQFLTAAMPLAQAEPNSKGPILQILKWTMAGFRGSKEIEGVMDRAIDQIMREGDQRSSQPSDEQIKAQAAREKMQHEEKMADKKHQHSIIEIREKAKADMAELREELRSAIMQIREEMTANIMTEAAQADAAMEQDDHETQNTLELEAAKARHAKNVAASQANGRDD
jgi:hypothetical protein